METILTVINKEDWVEIQIENPLWLIKKTKKNWVAYSPQFRVFGYSPKSEEVAIEKLRKSLDLFFEVHAERDTIPKALEYFGWKKQQKKPHKLGRTFKTHKHPIFSNETVLETNYSTLAAC